MAGSRWARSSSASRKSRKRPRSRKRRAIRSKPRQKSLPVSTEKATQPKATTPPADPAMNTADTFHVSAEQAGQTVAALLRQWQPGATWSQVKQQIAGRRVKINGELWLDAARRL